MTAWFTDAWEEIENMEQNGTETRTINMMKGYYSQAESEWQEYDYDRTKLYLQKIIALPETPSYPSSACSCCYYSCEDPGWGR